MIGRLNKTNQLRKLSFKGKYDGFNNGINIGINTV